MTMNVTSATTATTSTPPTIPNPIKKAATPYVEYIGNLKPNLSLVLAIRK